jgi:hypothetical protein
MEKAIIYWKTEISTKSVAPLYTLQSSQPSGLIEYSWILISVSVFNLFNCVILIEVHKGKSVSLRCGWKTLSYFNSPHIDVDTPL